MYNLQELIEHGYVEKIETESTCVGSGYKVYVKLHNYSIGRVIIDVGIDERLDDAVLLINKMIEVDEELDNTRKLSNAKPARKATEEEIDKILEASKQAFKD